MTGRVWVVGSLNLDLRLRTPRLPRPGETVAADQAGWWPGGKGANQAVAARAAGADVRLVGAVGDDVRTTTYIARLRQLGLELRLDVQPRLDSGQAVVMVADDGQNSIVVVPGANARLDEAHVQASLGDIDDGDVLLAQLETPLEVVTAAVQRAHDAGARVILNASPPRRLPDTLLAHVDLLVVNETEAAELPDPAVPICVTLGDRGARWGEAAATAPAVAVVDTTGAGDAFAGALAAALARGDTPDTALRHAVRAGADACTREGAQGWTLDRTANPPT